MSVVLGYEDLSERAESLAEELYRKYYGCSQMTLRAIQEVLGLENDEVFKAASALAGGVAGNGEVCGALLGALMAVGQVYGRDRLEITTESTNYSKAMKVGAKIFEEFKDHYGSVRCKDIQVKLFGRYYDVKSPEEYREFLNSGAAHKCGGVCKVAARIAVKKIMKQKNQFSD